MMRVNTMDEALAVAKTMCSKHPDLVKTVGTTGTPRDVALKIFLSEVSSDPSSGFKYDVTPPRSEPRQAAAGADAATPVGSASATGADGSSTSAPAAHAATVGPAPNPTDRQCPYCDDAGTRYCKNTGRRHETPEEKSVRLWRHMYKQLVIASNFINTARLAKKNTCVEDYAVELDLDDF